MSAPPPPRDPYDLPQPFLRRHQDGAWAVVVFALTVVLTVMSFPPHHAPEFAYAFAAPAILWAYLRPPLKLYVWTMFGAQAVAWAILLGWLWHVTWAGPLLLGPFVGAWVGVWYLAAWWAAPRMVGRPTPARLAAMLGLAGAWVIIEWTRTWVIGGFPWLPLAASQALSGKGVAIIQIAAFTGASGVSFVLITVNVAFAAYLHRLLFEGPAVERRRRRHLMVDDDPSGLYEARDWGFRRRSQEFFLALFLLLACLCVFLVEVQPMARASFSQPFARVGFVQPDIPQSVKWEPGEAPGIVKVLEHETLEVGATQPDLILWPEASAPVSVKDDPVMRAIVEHMALRSGSPLLLGSIAEENVGGAEQWYNAALLVTPDGGLQRNYYAKRKLVPFGEYVPLRPLLGWLRKFVPIGDDATPGAGADPLVVGLRDGAAAFGPLICYEDIFPQLGRDSALAGSDSLVVLTNDAWYGEGAAAYQHAAHSVLRAVETRRPVLRCGNGGWSGWIDEFGYVRGVLENGDGSVYFRGNKVLSVSRDSRWIGRNSFYTVHGDWFVAFCAALGILGFLMIQVGRSEI
jgi:apolipoprotein N-acyltransferase